ncbi:hypothetical protein IW261DRAFT_1423009 [Armillaria novae-zelandiae]|uniref:Uncharacterized protein n=1 Tax=Armillaria novae-zelandiae TaxID=153914 RepID=A0AA39NYW4_9AGAR|nr:hypothetical protein IW261DRAFT_1423009 [Armillaria novae-zelandiae]
MTPIFKMDIPPKAASPHEGEKALTLRHLGLRSFPALHPLNLSLAHNMQLSICEHYHVFSGVRDQTSLLSSGGGYIHYGKATNSSAASTTTGGGFPHCPGGGSGGQTNSNEDSTKNSK